MTGKRGGQGTWNALLEASLQPGVVISQLIPNCPITRGPHRGATSREHLAHAIA